MGLLKLGSDSNFGSRLWPLLSLVALAYVVLFALSFMSDPLAQAPVLDARENLSWVERIRSGSLDAEPLYRALLYPLVLSALPASLLPGAAVLFGFCLHGLNALLVAGISARLWGLRSAAYGAGLLFAVYPVALYFSGQVLDITFSTSLFLGALYLLMWIADRSGERVAHLGAIATGLVAGAAVLARPNFLPAVLCFPVIALFLCDRSRFSSAGLLTLALVSTLSLQGLVNHRLSGEVRILPWQGAYNLYAANRDGANGKYYTQQLSFDRIPEGANTTRMESEWLYRKAEGADAPMNVGAMGKYWRGRLLDEVSEEPSRWLALMGRKVLYTLNDWEQYNNLTYAYHEARWPYLALNPLSWGVLLILASSGLWIGFPHAAKGKFISIALIGLAYAAGLLLFFVSARFRLPLVPLLCVAAGGWFFVGRITDWRRVLLPGLAVLALAVISFGNWYDAKDQQTFIQDEILLAKANSELGRDAEALVYSRKALKRDPDRLEAKWLELTSLFNLWLGNGDARYWRGIGEALISIESKDAAGTFIHGVYLWRESQPDEAVEVWRSALLHFGPSAGLSREALEAVGAQENTTGEIRVSESMRALLQL